MAAYGRIWPRMGRNGRATADDDDDDDDDDDGGGDDDDDDGGLGRWAPSLHTTGRKWPPGAFKP